MGQEEQLKEMLENYEGTLKTEESAEELIEDETKEDELDEADDSGDENPDGEDAPTEDEPEGGEKKAEGGDEEADELAKLRAEVESLRAKKVEESATEEQYSAEKETFKDLDFLEGISDDDLESFDRKTLNSIFNKIHSTAAKAALERAYAAIPNIVRASVNQQAAITRTVNDFYAANPELTEYKSTVAAIFEGILGKNPDWKLDKVFEETAKEARKKLALKDKAKASEKHQPKADSTRPPAIPRRPSTNQRPAAKTNDKLTPQQRQIEEMNKSLGF